MFADIQPSLDIPDWLPWGAGLAAAAWMAVIVMLAGRLWRGLPVIAGRPHDPVPWNGNDVLVILIGFVGIATMAGAITGPEPPLDLSLAMNMLVVTVATVLARAWLMARGATAADLGLAPVRPAEDVTLAIMGLALVVAPLLALAAWLNTIEPYEHPIVEFLASRREALGIGLVVVTACVVAPVGEEFFFRRVLQGWLEKLLPAGDGIAAVFLSAAAFALAHYEHGLAFLPLFPLGLVLGFTARQTGSIVPCILLHGLFNAVSVAILLAAPATG
jgi:membrane protease YdiL (CAAX protease family)